MASRKAMEKQITDNRPPPLEIYHLSKATVDQMTKENLELKDALKAAHPATKEDSDVWHQFLHLHKLRNPNLSSILSFISVLKVDCK